MELLFISLFLGICAIGVFRAPWAFALVLLMFPVEQVIQASCPTFRVSALGPSGINFAVAFTALFASARMSLRDQKFANWMNLTMIATLALYAWSIITLTWSPGAEQGFSDVIAQFPYLLLIIVISPLLIKNTDDLNEALQASLWIGLLSGIIILAGSDFTTFNNSRIGFEINGKNSNPLALGELGGTLLIIGATLRKSIITGIGIYLRFAAVIIGFIIALKSGSRGQFFIAAIVSVTFIPISAPVRNLFGFLATTVLVGIVLLIASYLLSTQLEGYAAKRFSTEDLLYGNSSASSRLVNVYALFTACMRSPVSIGIGLGYNAFSTLPEGAIDQYSHNLFADAIFELGLPGALFMSTIVWTGCRSTYQLLSMYRTEPVKRCVIATMGALIASQILLISKQGSLWGTPVFFPMMIVMMRIWLNIKDSEPEQSDAVEA